VGHLKLKLQQPDICKYMYKYKYLMNCFDDGMVLYKTCYGAQHNNATRAVAYFYSTYQLVKQQYILKLCQDYRTIAENSAVMWYIHIILKG